MSDKLKIIEQGPGDRIHVAEIRGDTVRKMGLVDQGGGSMSLPAYEGPYTVTPTQSEQRLQTTGKKMTADVVVGAIPNNYGLITWNGSVLTVS